MLSQKLDTIQRNAFPSQTLPDNIAGIITTFLPYVFAIVGILLLVYFILGGFSLMYAGGDPKKVQDGWAKKIQNVDSDKTIRAQIKLFLGLPNSARKSKTLDNGRENHLHFVLNRLGIETFFPIRILPGKEERMNTITDW